MKANRTREQILVSAARKGDPSAFYALFSEPARETYALLRAGGKNHRESVDLLSRLFGRIYPSFGQASLKTTPQEWFERKCRPLMGKAVGKMLPGAPAAPAPAERADLDGTLQVVLQRWYGRMERDRRPVSAVRRLGTFLFGHPAAHFAGILLLLGAGLAGAYVWMLATGHRLDISFSDHRWRHTVSIPSTEEGLLDTEVARLVAERPPLIDRKEPPVRQASSPATPAAAPVARPAPRPQAPASQVARPAATSLVQTATPAPYRKPQAVSGQTVPQRDSMAAARPPVPSAVTIPRVQAPGGAWTSPATAPTTRPVVADTSRKASSAVASPQSMTTHPASQPVTARPASQTARPLSPDSARTMRP